MKLLIINYILSCISVTPYSVCVFVCSKTICFKKRKFSHLLTIQIVHSPLDRNTDYVSSQGQIALLPGKLMHSLSVLQFQMCIVVHVGARVLCPGVQNLSQLVVRMMKLFTNFGQFFSNQTGQFAKLSLRYSFSVISGGGICLAEKKN